MFIWKSGKQERKGRSGFMEVSLTIRWATVMGVREERPYVDLGKRKSRLTAAAILGRLRDGMTGT